MYEKHAAFFMPVGVSHLVCGYSDRYQAGKTPSHQTEKETKMNDKETIQNLFSVLNGCLPYEYDVTLINDHGRTPNILIVKKDSDHIMQISPSKHDNTYTVLVCVDGDDPDTDSEIYQWDLDSPDTTLNTIIADIKNRL